MEEWKNIRGYQGQYQVSSLGRVRTTDWMSFNGFKKFLRSGRMLKELPNTNGYFKVALRQRFFSVHILVANAFLGRKPKGKEINHLDGVKTHNAASNLEWVTKSENSRHSNRLGLRGVASNVRAVCDMQTGIFYTVREAADLHGLSKSGMYAKLSGKNPNHTSLVYA